MILIWLLLGFYLPITGPAYAAPLLERVKFPVIYTGGTSHVFPNEDHPDAILSLIKNHELPDGVLLSVGFERSFIDAAILPHVSGLIVLDANSQIVNAAQMNSLLLSHYSEASDRYPIFRSQPNSELISEVRSTLRGYRSREIKAFLTTSKLLWKYRFGPSGKFSESVKYWTNQALREKLMKMAKQGRIVARQVDFLDFNGRLPRIIKSLKKQSEVISIVDLSNAAEWIFGELGLEKGAAALRYLFRVLEPVLQKDAILLFTFEPSNAFASKALAPFEYGIVSLSHLKVMPDHQLLQTLSPTGVNERSGYKRQLNSYLPGSCESDLK